MQILFDNIIFSLQKAGGISTYWFELTSRTFNDNSNIIFYEGKDNNNNSFNKLKALTRRVILFNEFFLFFNRFLKVNISICRNKFIFHSSYYRINSNINAINVVTVHDFIHELYYSGFRKFLNSYLKKRAINSADAIITVSKNTKFDLLKLYPGISENKIIVIYNGVSDDFYLIDSNSDTSNYFLFVGSREYYKNFDFTVKCVANNSSKDLYIVGGNLNRNEIDFLNTYLPGRWKLFTYISNEKLNILYNNAYALLYLSSYEGFGIPILEAMKCGCPFIALNASSIPEVAGDAGVLLPKLDFNHFLVALSHIDENRSLIIEKGFVQVSKFSWENCFKNTIGLYNQLLNENINNYSSL